MRRRIVLGFAAAAATIAMLVPAAGSAAPRTCVVADGPGGLHLQLGYAPNGPEDCRRIP